MVKGLAILVYSYVYRQIVLANRQKRRLFLDKLQEFPFLAGYAALDDFGRQYDADAKLIG